MGISTHKITWVKADITDVFAFDDFIEENDYIIHTAALVDVLKRVNPRLYETNTNSTLWLLDSAKRNNCSGFCFVSSVAALGQNADETLPIDETVTFKRLKSNSSYAVSKFVSEMSVWSASQEGMNVVSIKPSVILGWSPGNYDIINMAKLIEKKWFKAPSGSFGFVLADDVAAFCLQLYHQNIYNESFILNNRNLSYLNLYHLFAKSLHNKWSEKCSNPSNLKALGWVSDILNIAGASIPFSLHLAETVIKNKRFDNSKSLQVKGFEYCNLETKLNSLFEDYNRFHKK